MEHILKNVAIDIIEVQRTRCGAWWNYRDVNSPFTRLYYVAQGEGTVWQNGSSYRLLPGTVTAIPAHTLSHYRCIEHMDLYWIHATATIASAVDFFTIVDSVRQLRPEPPERAAARFVEAADLWAGHAERQYLELDAAVRCILSLFAESLAPAALVANMESYARFRPVLSFVGDHLGDRITLDHLARIANLAPNYFSNLFTRHFGIPPLRYIQRRRVEESKRLLWGTDLGLEGIARRLGFTDAFHFSRTFKGVSGISPSQFRRQKGIEA